MASDQYIQQDGIVSQSLGNAKFLVKVDGIGDVLCTLSGKIRQNAIRILDGDKVSIDISAVDPSKGRITYRYKK